MNSLQRRVLALVTALGFALCLQGTATFAQTTVINASGTASPVATPAPSVSCVPTAAAIERSAEQSADYATASRSYVALSSNPSKSFPDLGYFTGLDCVRTSEVLSTIPTYVPICAAETGSGASPTAGIAAAAGAKTAADVNQQIAQQVMLAYRDIRNLVYRLRACDYFLSVYAWNTRTHGHDAAFDYSWKTGCNSFLYEDQTGKSLQDEVDQVNGIANAIPPPPSPKGGTSATLAELTALKARLSKFLFAEYDLSNDLSQRLESCASIVDNLAYPPNAHRFFCTYGGFIGAFLTASAAAFGKRWGTNTSTQGEVQGLGTVMIALPALCASNATAAKAKG